MTSFEPRFPPALNNLRLIHQGKSRDTFATTLPQYRLIVATDRLSTHNIVHKSPVPGKGEVVTDLIVFWLTGPLAKAGIKHHLVAHGKDIYDYLPGRSSDYPSDLHRRAIVVQELDMTLVEFIYRGYNNGSFYHKHYSNGLDPYGLDLPRGLPLMHRFDQPIFTPTEKSETDPPMNAEAVKQQHPEATRLGEKVFKLVRRHLNDRSIEFVDTKFEFGVNKLGEVVLADEMATPDSSRLCLTSDIKVGEEPPWLDKQIARDEAERIWGHGPKTPLTFSEETISKLSATYVKVLDRITS